MKVFLSWSGPQSKKVAESLKQWLKMVIQAVDPFVSSVDIAKGDRGLRVIATELEQSSFGIVCVTRQNSLAPWVNFEAGALSKAVGEASLVPFLLDMPVSDLTGPLAQFQVVSGNNKEDVFSMVRALRDRSESRLDDALLRTTFDAFWPTLERELEEARRLGGNVATVTAVRDPADVLEEVLVLARRQDSILRTIVERVDSSMPMLEVTKGPPTPNEKPEDRKETVDELIAALHTIEDKARTYRVNANRVPEEVQVVYGPGAVSRVNADVVRASVEAFVARRNVHVTVKTMDGYQILAGPGTETVMLTPAEAQGS